MSYLEETIARFIPERNYRDFKDLRREALRLYLNPEDCYDKKKIQEAIVNVISSINALYACAFRLLVKMLSF